MAAVLERCEPCWKTDLLGKPAISEARERYRIGARTGRGRIGHVYVSTGLGGNYAIKMIECKDDKEVNWAASELHILMTVSGNRNVVSFIDAFYSDGMQCEKNKVATINNDPHITINNIIKHIINNNTHTIANN